MEMEILKLKIKTKPCFSPHFMNKHTTTRFFHRACTCRARNKKGKRPKGEKCGRKKRKENMFSTIRITVVDDRVCVTVSPAFRQPPRDLACTIDHSGSMAANCRVANARSCAAVLASLSRNTSFFGFGDTIARLIPGKYVAMNQGTRLSAAANALIEAAGQPGIDASATVVIITDCESVTDYAAAFTKLQSSLSFAGRRYVLLGFGSNHAIHDLMTLIPAEHAEQGCYINVSDTTTAIPTASIEAAMQTAAVQFQGRTVFVKPGTSYLVPAGVAPVDIVVDGRPALEYSVSSPPVTEELLAVLAEAAACTATRVYNGALSVLKRSAAAHSQAVLQPVRDLVRNELLYLERVLDRLRMSSDYGAVLERVQRVAEATSAGNPAPVASRDAVDLCRGVLRRPPGVERLLDLLRKIKALVDGPPSAEAYAAAAELFDATSRGNLSTASLSKLCARVAERQDVNLYQAVHKRLTQLETGSGTGTGTGLGLTKDEEDFAAAVDKYAEGEVGWPFECVVTTSSDNCCVVATGKVSRRPLVGAMNPTATRAVTVDLTPYDLRAVYTCLGNGVVGDAHTFRSCVGDVDGIVGVFPGNSRAAEGAFTALTSEIGTGSWTSPVGGLMGLVSLLVGVEELLARGRDDAARVLAFGFLGVAARVKCRVPASNGEVRKEDPLVTGLVASERLLTAASLAPSVYLGPQFMRAGLWTALAYAIALLHSMRESTPGWDQAALANALQVYEIAAAASWAVQPCSRTDEASYPGEMKTITAFRREVASRIGLSSHAPPVPVPAPVPAPVVLKDSLRAFLALPMTYTYTDAVDMSRESVAESVFLSAHLPRAYLEQPLLRPGARAAFWASVGSNISCVSIEALAAFSNPGAWETGMSGKFTQLREAAHAFAVQELREACTIAYRNATDTTPLTIFDAAVLNVLLPEEPRITAPAVVAFGNEEGICAGIRTGMPSVCTTMDSPKFLRGSVGSHLACAYPRDGRPCYTPSIPRMHATLMAWWTKLAVREDDVVLGLARGEWPAVDVGMLETFVRQWLFQRRAFDVVKTGPADMDAAEACRRMGLDTSTSTAAAWDARDTELRAMLYGASIKEWSYEEAVVHFYVSLKRDTRVDSRIFNARPFLGALAKHRRFVLPRRIYEASLAAHGIAPSLLLTVEVFSGIVDDVYATLARERR